MPHHEFFELDQIEFGSTNTVQKYYVYYIQILILQNN